MKVGNYLNCISNTVRKFYVDGNDESKGYVIHQGFLPSSIRGKINREIYEIKVINGVIHFLIEDAKESVKVEEFVTPLLSETLVLLKDIKLLRIKVDGEFIDKMKVKYLDMEVKSLYSNEYDTLFIEI